MLLSLLQSPADLEHSTTPESDVQAVLIFPQRKQRHPGPDTPHRGVPPEQWPDVLRRVEQGDSVRELARDYHVSYQTIHRIVQAMRKRGEEEQP